MGEITIEEAMQLEFASVRATEDEVRATVKAQAPIRDGFGDWVDWCLERDCRIVIVSNGFRSVIEPVLAEAGMGHLEVVAHDARFSRDGCELVWSERGERCALCGRRCKRAPLRARWDGETLVYLGDGISDRCVSLMADMIFARDGLSEHLTERDVPFIPFEDFHDVRAALEAAA